MGFIIPFYFRYSFGILDVPYVGVKVILALSVSMLHLRSKNNILCLDLIPGPDIEAGES
jgi:hypothetical protein